MSSPIARPSLFSKLVRAFSHVTHRILTKIRVIWYNLTAFIFYKPLPWSTTVYGRIRMLHRPCRLSVGKECRLGDGVYLATSMTSTITLGDCVSVQIGSVFVAVEGITIGDGCAIAEYVSIRDQNHRTADGESVRDLGFDSAPVEIGKNVWIGRSVYIGAGAKIGDNCVIGANSVVHGEFPPNSLIVGAPAKVKKILHQDEAEKAIAAAKADQA